MSDRAVAEQRRKKQSQMARYDRRGQRTSSNIFSAFTQQEIQEFKEAFNMIDQNHDGFIDHDDLIDMLTSLGAPAVHDDEVAKMLSDAAGPVNFTMFLTMFSERLQNTDPGKVLLNAFRTFDEQETGYVSEDRLRHLLTSFCNRWTQEMVDELYSSPQLVDSRGFNYIEFVRRIKGYVAAVDDEEVRQEQQKQLEESSPTAAYLPKMMSFKAPAELIPSLITKAAASAAPEQTPKPNVTELPQIRATPVQSPIPAKATTTTITSAFASKVTTEEKHILEEIRTAAAKTSTSTFRNSPSEGSMTISPPARKVSTNNSELASTKSPTPKSPTPVSDKAASEPIAESATRPINPHAEPDSFSEPLTKSVSMVSTRPSAPEPPAEPINHLVDERAKKSVSPDVPTSPISVSSSKTTSSSPRSSEVPADDEEASSVTPPSPTVGVRTSAEFYLEAANSPPEQKLFVGAKQQNPPSQKTIAEMRQSFFSSQETSPAPIQLTTPKLLFEIPAKITPTIQQEPQQQETKKQVVSDIVGLPAVPVFAGVQLRSAKTFIPVPIVPAKRVSQEMAQKIPQPPNMVEETTLPPIHIEAKYDNKDAPPTIMDVSPAVLAPETPSSSPLARSPWRQQMKPAVAAKVSGPNVEIVEAPPIVKKRSGSADNKLLQQVPQLMQKTTTSSNMKQNQVVLMQENPLSRQTAAYGYHTVTTTTTTTSLSDQQQQAMASEEQQRSPRSLFGEQKMSFAKITLTTPSSGGDAANLLPIRASLTERMPPMARRIRAAENNKNTRPNDAASRIMSSSLITISTASKSAGSSASNLSNK